MTGLIAATASVLLVSPGSAGVPPEWRRPTPAELSDEWRDKSSHRYAAVVADFDGDGLEDHAGLFVADSPGETALILVRGSGPNSSTILERFDDPGWIEVMGVEVVPPGSYKTACGKGYWECESGEPELLTVTLPAIDLFKVGSANSYFFYDVDRREMRRVWISD